MLTKWNARPPAILNHIIFITRLFSPPVFEIMCTLTWPVRRNRHALRARDARGLTLNLVS